MNIKQIVIIIFISILAFSFIDAIDREQERKAEIETYYDGVFSGCILVYVSPNMSEVTLFEIGQKCTLKTNMARQAGMMELYYKEPVPPPPLEDVTEY